MPDSYEVKVTVGDAEIDVKGPKEGVVEIVKALSDVLVARPKAATPTAVTDDTPRRPPTIDARSFFNEKSPSSQAEAIAVATYYITELAPPEMRAETIDKERAQEVFRQAKHPLPRRMEQVLVNAKNAGYLARVSAGEYRLSPVGFNLVDHALGPNA